MTRAFRPYVLAVCCGLQVMGYASGMGVWTLILAVIFGLTALISAIEDAGR